MSGNKAVFLDRDGVINQVCYHDEKGIYSATNLKEFKVLPNVKKAIKSLKDHGFKTVVITNQPGVAFGYLKKTEVEKIDKFIKKKLGIDVVYNCYHHPKITGKCNCRKPKDGMVKQAVKDFNINLNLSFMVGDNLIDIKTGERCKETFLIARKKSVDLLNLIEDLNIHPTHIVKSLEEATNIILSSSKYLLT